MHVRQAEWIALLIALPAAALAVAPAVIPWQAAAGHVGHLVTVEGEVAAAHTTGDGCVLEFAPDDPRAFRVVLLVPLLSGLPHQPERLYVGKRVQASGHVQRFAERPEMVLRNPDQIVIVDVAGGAAPPATAAAPPQEPAPPPRGLAEAVRERIAPGDPCARARERWREAATTVTDRSLALRRCLDALGYHCRTDAAAIAPALAALEWAEQQVEASCP